MVRDQGPGARDGALGCVTGVLRVPWCVTGVLRCVTGVLRVLGCVTGVLECVTGVLVPGQSICSKEHENIL